MSTTGKVLIGSGIFLLGYAVWKNKEKIISQFDGSLSGIGSRPKYTILVEGDYASSRAEMTREDLIEEILHKADMGVKALAEWKKGKTGGRIWRLNRMSPEELCDIMNYGVLRYSVKY